MYEIFIRDANLRRVGQITDFNKMEFIPRFNAVGSFALDLPTDSIAARELMNTNYGIIVKKDGGNIFSGTVKSRKRSFNGSNDTMILSGKDDNNSLNIRLAFPAPSGIFTESDYDVRSGPAETVMKQYVDYNCGASGLLERRLLSVEADTGLGSNVTGRARFNNLIDLLSSIALNGGNLGFKVVQIDDYLEFQVYQPTDKTRSAFFSPLLGNLASFDYSNDDPEANFVIVGGGGEGAARVILQKSNNDSLVKHGRIESFVDQRNTTDSNELNQSANEELTNKAEKNTFTFTPIDTPQLAFNRDYGLGDRVSIVLTQPNEVIDVETLYYFISAYQTVPMQSERVRKIQEKIDVIQDIVREVKITIDSNGEVITPTVGNQDSNNAGIIGIFDKMRKITRRISNLERR
jgi:hypothetical protein